jgi:hypothetical protein
MAALPHCAGCGARRSGSVPGGTRDGTRDGGEDRQPERHCSVLHRGRGTRTHSRQRHGRERLRLARRLGWTGSKLIRFLDQEDGEGRITRSIGSTGRALIVVSDPVRTQPTERIAPEHGPDGVAGGGWWNAIGRGVVGVVLVGAGVTLAVSSMQANAWSGDSLTRVGVFTRPGPQSAAWDPFVVRIVDKTPFVSPARTLGSFLGTLQIGNDLVLSCTNGGEAIQS